jgi:hypothetical protein
MQNIELSTDRKYLKGSVSKYEHEDNYNNSEDYKNTDVMNISDSVEGDSDQDDLSEEEYNDFGFLQILKKEDIENNEFVDVETDYNDFLNLKTLPKHYRIERKKAKYKETFDECKRMTSIGDCIENFAKYNNDYHDIPIPDIIEDEETDKDKDDNKDKDENDEPKSQHKHHDDMFEPETVVDKELYLNTKNSYIVEDQRKLILEDNLKMAKEMNIQYQKKKKLYEANLINILIGKYHEEGGKLIFSKTFDTLEKTTVVFRKQVDKLKANKDSIPDEKYKDICEQAKRYLESFIKNLNKEMKDKFKSQEYEKNFVAWKHKLSELVNIWDLNTKEGIQLKFPHKYLLLKKFIARRAYMQQNNMELIMETQGNKNIFSQLLGSQLKLIGLGEKASKTNATGLIFLNDFNKIFFDIIFALTLVYSYITVPLRIFMMIENPMYEMIEKYVDLIFYIDVAITFRTVYTDKFNESVKDINLIAQNYVTNNLFTDFISAVPWHLLFVGSNYYSTAKAVVNCLKLLRIIKLAPVAEKIAEIKSIANWFKLIKLFVVYFFMTHWSACIMYSVLQQAIEWGEMTDDCYYTYGEKTRDTITYPCRFVLAFYNGSYFITGQVTENVIASDLLFPTSEYLFIIIDFILGQIISAYIFGGMASVIQSLNDGDKVFTDKIDIINGHMLFYDVSGQVVHDVKIYYDYLWQRHKDLITGKSNFYLLSKSLREKFERLNLPGNEFYLAKFVNLGSGSSKLVGNILMGLEKMIIFPHEILFEEKSITKGIYVLLNGDIELTNKEIPNVAKESHTVEIGDVLNRSNNLEEIDSRPLDEKDSVIFPLVPAFIKTGRNYQLCFSSNFTDLLFMSLEHFNQILINFPIEMHVLRHVVMTEASKNKLLENKYVFEVIGMHSSRSIGKYYEKEFNKFTIWIPIPIPISQRKIAKNYMKSFIKKVRNQSKEIILSADMNINLCSHLIVGILKNKEEKNFDLDIHKNVSGVEKMKILSRTLLTLSKKYVTFGIDYEFKIKKDILPEEEEEEDE